ncbi:hypothetical protein ACFW1A_00670 [Kitasatospora sp. NPDC058965]|uniref:hypothetical protein n=1 Tax=Kitasatospora sp. NPDC058965 TaxID=3346682 RepID=UPI0036967D11
MNSDNTRPVGAHRGQKALAAGSTGEKTRNDAEGDDAQGCQHGRDQHTIRTCLPCADILEARAALAEAVEYHLAVAVLVGWDDVLAVVGHVHHQFSQMLATGRGRSRHHQEVVPVEKAAAKALRDLARIHAQRHFAEHTGVGLRSPLDPDQPFRLSGRRLARALLTEHQARSHAAEALLQQRLAYVRSLRTALAKYGVEAIDATPAGV